jgi:hypothetical protein
LHGRRRIAAGRRRLLRRLGQKAPKGKEKNFIKTDPDKGFFVAFRFYGPLEGYIEKTWVMNDFELID